MRTYIVEKNSVVGIFQIVTDSHPWTEDMAAHFDKWVEVDPEQLAGVSDVSKQVTIVGDSEPEWDIVIDTGVPSSEEEAIQAMRDAWDHIEEFQLAVPQFDIEEPGNPTPTELYNWITNDLNDYLSNIKEVVNSLVVLANKVPPNEE